MSTHSNYSVLVYHTHPVPKTFLSERITEGTRHQTASRTSIETNNIGTGMYP